MLSVGRSLISRTSSCVPRYLSSSADKITIYGHYVSQPSRAVLWLLQIQNQPFDFVRVDVLKGDARKDAYKSKFPTCLIPGLEDGDLHLAEGTAILQYLCEKHGWDQWWPIANDVETRQKRAKIAEFLSSHHHTTRLVSHSIVRPLFSGKRLTDEQKEGNVKTAEQIMSRFENVFLASGPYINGMSHPTIADLTAYCELGQLLHFHILPNFDNHPALKAWTDRMQQLPHHDDVHASNFKMGGLFKKTQE